MSNVIFFFFFQAEDGIRDKLVTGVQTCALPISLRCRILAEGANGPTTLGADRILEEKGVFVIPDILANSGGVIVSYFEWVQDVQKYFWKEQDIRDRLHEIITAAFRRTLEFAQTKKVSMRMAALMNGINKIVQAHLARGLYP